jgi:hypothetical protein
MAIDLTQIATGIVTQGVTEINALVNTLSALEDLYEFAVGAGIATFTTFEEDIQAAHPHLDGAKLNQVLGVIIPALMTWLTTQTIADGDYAGTKYAAMLNKVRTQ